VAYGKSNGHVTGNVTWLWKVKVMTPIRLGPNIFLKQPEMLLSNNR